MTAAQRTAPRPRRTWPQRLVLALGVLLVVGCAASAFGVAYGGWKFSQVAKYDLSLAKVDEGEPANYLIVGSDSREAVAKGDANSGAFLDGTAGGRRSDTILVVRVDPRTKSAAMLSLPRDLWVPIAGKDEEQRINAAYGMGKQVLADTIQQYLGIPVNHYIEVDFRGFQGLVGAIGGVPMYFERAMKDTNSGLDVLHPGCTTLDGPSALAFARSRHLQYMQRGVWHTDPTGDLGRITRQQLFIRKAISRSVSKGLTNPLTLKHLIDVGVANVGIDDGLSAQALAGLGSRFARFKGDQLVTYTLPATADTTSGGASILRLDARAAVPVLDLFRDQKGAVPGGGEPAHTGPLTEPDVHVKVLNGSGVDHKAANVAAALGSAGFAVDGTGNAEEVGPAQIDRTEVRYNPADGEAANLVGRHLTAGAELTADPDVAAGTVVVVTGRDFTKVEAAALPSVPGGSSAPVGDATTTTAPTATTAPAAPPTTEQVGRTPGEPPPGESCG